VVPDDAVDVSRVEPLNSVERDRVEPAVLPVAGVVVQIGRDHEERPVAATPEHIGQPGRETAPAVGVARPEGDTDYPRPRGDTREQRQLHFDGVLALVRDRIELEVGDGLGQLTREPGV